MIVSTGSKDIENLNTKMDLAMKLYKTTILATALLSAFSVTHAATSDGKRFAVSAGWLHVMPQGEKQGISGSTTKQTPLLGVNAQFHHRAQVLKLKMLILQA